MYPQFQRQGSIVLCSAEAVPWRISCLDNSVPVCSMVVEGLDGQPGKNSIMPCKSSDLSAAVVSEQSLRFCPSCWFPSCAHYPSPWTCLQAARQVCKDAPLSVSIPTVSCGNTGTEGSTQLQQSEEPQPRVSLSSGAIWKMLWEECLFQWN